MLPDFLRALVGKRVTGIARILYSHLGIDSADGALELTADGCTVLLDGGSDGESLRVTEGAWNDPFGGPRSEESEEFLRTHGRWTRVDRADEAPYAELVGQELTQIHALENQWGTLASVRVSVPTRDMWIVVEGDECHVFWAAPDGFSEV